MKNYGKYHVLKFYLFLYLRKSVPRHALENIFYGIFQRQRRSFNCVISMRGSRGEAGATDHLLKIAKNIEYLIISNSHLLCLNRSISVSKQTKRRNLNTISDTLRENLSSGFVILAYSATETS